jgi:hypothetical protein
MARTDLTDRSSAKLVAKVLSDPTLFPDEFKAWLPRWLQGNVNFSVDSTQLPDVESQKLVGVTGNAQFSNSWTNFGGTNASAAYYKDPFGRVFLKGTVKSGTVNTAIFTLPVGYRPQEAEVFAVYCNGAVGFITVNPDGTVVQSGGGSNASLTLSGISFRAYS